MPLWAAISPTEISSKGLWASSCFMLCTKHCFVCWDEGMIPPLFLRFSNSISVFSSLFNRRRLMRILMIGADAPGLGAADALRARLRLEFITGQVLPFSAFCPEHRTRSGCGRRPSRPASAGVHHGAGTPLFRLLPRAHSAAFFCTAGSGRTGAPGTEGSLGRCGGGPSPACFGTDPAAARRAAGGACAGAGGRLCP